jgi:hypothetical protein
MGVKGIDINSYTPKAPVSVGAFYFSSYATFAQFLAQTVVSMMACTGYHRASQTEILACSDGGLSLCVG